MLFQARFWLDRIVKRQKVATSKLFVNVVYWLNNERAIPLSSSESKDGVYWLTECTIRRCHYSKKQWNCNLIVNALIIYKRRYFFIRLSPEQTSNYTTQCTVIDIGIWLMLVWFTWCKTRTYTIWFSFQLKTCSQFGNAKSVGTLYTRLISPIFIYFLLRFVLLSKDRKTEKMYSCLF